MAKPDLLVVAEALIACAFTLALGQRGSNNEARMAMMAMTTNSSIRVNPLLLEYLRRWRQWSLFFSHENEYAVYLSEAWPDPLRQNWGRRCLRGSMHVTNNDALDGMERAHLGWRLAKTHFFNE